MKEELVEKYFRPGRLPHLWCPGCGNGVVLAAMIEAVDRLGLTKDEVAFISGRAILRPLAMGSARPWRVLAVLKST